MPSPMVTFKNETVAEVEWGHLFHAGGPVVRYEVNVTHQTLMESHLMAVKGKASRIIVAFDEIGNDMSWLPDCFNDSVTNLYNFTVRAITHDSETGKFYEGDWSPVEVTPAYCEGAYFILYNIFYFAK